MTPRLSILMPTHERPDTLRLAIASVQAQDFADWELLVCGDGCGAETDALMQHVCAADHRVRWFPHPKAPGFGYANRNLVLNHARGPLIGFAAHDNLVFSDHWTRLVALLDEPAVQMAASSAAWVDDAGRIVPTVFPLSDPAVMTRFLEKKDNRLPANAFVYRRELHDAVGRWDAALTSRGDQDLWARIIRHVGVENFRSTPVISFLHFRAPWKTPDIADPHQGSVWHNLFAAPDRLPSTLRVPVPAGALIQQVFADLLHGVGGRAWESSLRTACAQALETFAHEADRRWAKAERDLARLRTKKNTAPATKRRWWQRLAGQ